MPVGAELTSVLVEAVHPGDDGTQPQIAGGILGDCTVAAHADAVGFVDMETVGAGVVAIETIRIGRKMDSCLPNGIFL